MNKFIYLLLTISPLTFILPAISQELIRTSSTWQISSRCSLWIKQENINTESSKTITDAKCFGISVTRARNFNIHFYTSHPSSENPFVSFVMAEGPFRGVHPVESSVLFLGQKEQVYLAINGGECKLLNSNMRSTMAQCSSTTKTQPDGNYLVIIATATLDKPISPQIQDALE